MANLKEFMERTKTVNGYFVAKVFVMGAFCGALLTVMWMWVAAVK